jgi:hypothetical protein
VLLVGASVASLLGRVTHFTSRKSRAAHRSHVFGVAIVAGAVNLISGLFR